MALQPQAADYERKISTLNAMLNKAESQVSFKDKHVPIAITFGVLAPLIIAGVLLLWQPQIVLSKEGNKSVKSTKKIFFWTLGLTLIVWVLLFLVMRYVYKKL